MPLSPANRYTPLTLISQPPIRPSVDDQSLVTDASTALSEDHGRALDLILSVTPCILEDAEELTASLLNIHVRPARLIVRDLISAGFIAIERNQAASSWMTFTIVRSYRAGHIEADRLRAESTSTFRATFYASGPFYSCGSVCYPEPFDRAITYSFTCRSCGDPQGPLPDDWWVE